MTPDQRRGFLPGVAVGVAIGLAAALAVVVAGWLAGPDDDPVVRAREVIEDNYFRDPEAGKLDDASIGGMVDSIRKRYDDRFSHYFTASQLEAFDAATSGRFSGVGLTVTEVRRGLRVASVLPETPAERRGLERGDVIVAVDGKSIEGVSSEVSTTEIKGPPGTEVELRVVPDDGGRPRDLTLERADVRLPAVKGAIRRGPGGEKVAYVRFATFSEGAHGELREEIERLDRRGAEGLVLDLRGNGGGLLNEAVLSTSVLLDQGNVVSTRSRTQGDRDYAAVGDALEPRPTAILVNRDTASAAEIMAAALQEHDIAGVVGTRTYGKGTFQELIDLPGGGGLDLTIGEYLTADGTSILGTGVKPNVRVAAGPPNARKDAQLERALGVVGAQLPAGP